MTYDEWIKAGRPHWQCKECRGIFVTIPVADDFTCWECDKKRKTAGTYRVRGEFFISATDGEAAFQAVGEYMSALANKNEAAQAITAKQFKTYSFSLDLLDENGDPVYVHEHDDDCLEIGDGVEE